MLHAREEEYEAIELFGHMALFTNSRIDRDSVPEGFYCYDIRYSDFDDAVPATLEPFVYVNHMGTVLTKTDFDILKKDYTPMDEDSLNFLGHSLTVDGYLEEWAPSSDPIPRVIHFQEDTVQEEEPQEAGFEMEP